MREVHETTKGKRPKMINRDQKEWLLSQVFFANNMRFQPRQLESLVRVWKGSTEKKFKLNRKKKNFRDCSNICLPGLRTYKKKTKLTAASAVSRCV